MKVRGFQGTFFFSSFASEVSLTIVFVVAPAELEGHLLNHPDVSDTCVVGIPDEYSGEVPLAFVTLSQDAQTRVRRDPSEADKIKASIMKVICLLNKFLLLGDHR